jgi:hypothetical protein
MRKVIVAKLAFGVLMLLSTSFAVQIHPVARDGRKIQLDGFLLEWKKSDARPLGRDSSWSWDAINTREGLTGYFKAEKQPVCKGPWTFRFLPCRLSPYLAMEIHTDPAAADSFYRVTHSETVPEKDVTCEWIIPWKNVCHDSAGEYQVGLFAFDACGDSVQPLILTGHIYNPKKPSWGGAYGKMILVGIMLVLLFIMQKTTRRKFQKRK